ncbi:MAG TPA: hypothetical protein VE710_12715 [Candidatus Bathyarchaeia archaeon]|nr:hypothetical protein [Candidatus Bathyarchaeia archaeon]
MKLLITILLLPVVFAILFAGYLVKQEHDKVGIQTEHVLLAIVLVIVAILWNVRYYL